MKYRETECDESVEFTIRLDLETVAWLMELAYLNQAPPALVLASIIRDTREDDEAEHGEGPMPSVSPTQALN